ncbi:MAG: DUF4367 domain-containing protein [Acetanaerobacterium sp.]
MKDSVDGIQFETLLHQAVTEGCIEELRALPDEARLSELYRFSESFLCRMDRLIGRHKRLDGVTRAVKACSKAVAVLILAFGLLFGTLLAVSPQVRAATASVVMEWFKDHAQFSFQQSRDSQAAMDWRPQYVPQGYVEQQAVSTGHMINVYYINEDPKRIIFTRLSRAGGFTVGVDNEDKTPTTVTINGSDATLLVSDIPEKDNTLIWETEEAGFVLSGTIDTEELIRMAESVSAQ